MVDLTHDTIFRIGPALFLRTGTYTIMPLNCAAVSWIRMQSPRHISSDSPKVGRTYRLTDAGVRRFIGWRPFGTLSEYVSALEEMDIDSEALAGDLT